MVIVTVKITIYSDYIKLKKNAQTIYYLVFFFCYKQIFKTILQPFWTSNNSLLILFSIAQIQIDFLNFGKCEEH